MCVEVSTVFVPKSFINGFMTIALKVEQSFERQTVGWWKEFVLGVEVTEHSDCLILLTFQTLHMYGVCTLPRLPTPAKLDILSLWTPKRFHPLKVPSFNHIKSAEKHQAYIKLQADDPSSWSCHWPSDLQNFLGPDGWWKWCLSIWDGVLPSFAHTYWYHEAVILR